MISTMLEYKDRLAHAMQLAGLKTADLARALGLSYQAVDRVLKGRTNALKADNHAQAARALNVNPDWLATGQGPIERGLTIPPPPPGIPLKVESLRPIYAVGKGAGGLMTERVWNDGGYPVGATDQYALLGTSDPNAFLSEVVGNSMWPKYENHNFALIEPNTDIDVEDVVLVRLHTGETMLKRLLSRRNGVTLGSYNDPEQFHFTLGEVTWMYYAAHEVPRKKIKSRY